jgi:hypothetical protein
MELSYVFLILMILYFTFGTNIMSSFEGARDYSGNIPALYFGLTNYNDLLKRFIK